MCHQTVGLIGRHLEANGIPTVIMGCAKDIVEHVGVARFLCSDFPLGNSAGKPNDVHSQRETLALALDLFDTATEPRTTLLSPQRWSETDDWQRDFMNVALLSPQRIEQLREDYQAQRRTANALKQQPAD